MTQEEKRIKIAESQGWIFKNYGPKEFPDLYWELISPSGVSLDRGHTSKNFLAMLVPNYFNDLNACHAAENTLSEFQHHHFAHWLHHDLGHKSVSATASIRAERFGITLGLWKEGE